MRMRATCGWVIAALVALAACGGEEPEAAAEPAAPAAVAPVEVQPTAAPAEPQAGLDGLVVDTPEGERVGADTVEVEDGETGETTTVAQTAEGSTVTQGEDREVTQDAQGETTAREGANRATVRRDTVVASDGQNQVTIRRDGRGVSIGGLTISR